MLQESDQCNSVPNNTTVNGNLLSDLTNATTLLNIDGFAPEDDFDDYDLDDDLDPAMKEEIDR